MQENGRLNLLRYDCHKSLAEMQPSVKSVDTVDNMYVDSTNFDVATTLITKSTSSRRVINVKSTLILRRVPVRIYY